MTFISLRSSMTCVKSSSKFGNFRLTDFLQAFRLFCDRFLVLTEFLLQAARVTLKLTLDHFFFTLLFLFHLFDGLHLGVLVDVGHQEAREVNDLLKVLDRHVQDGTDF